MYTELWQVIGLQSEEAKKCSLQKLFLPLFSFLQEKVRELEDAEFEQQKVLGPAHLPRRMGSDRFKLPIALLACCKSCVWPCVRGMGIHPNPACLCMWQVVFFNLGLVWRQTAWRKNWSQRRRKHCSTRNWEVFTCCSYFYALQRMNKESVRLHS